MKFTVKQIADITNGTVEGDELATVSSLSKIEEGGENTLTFLANPKYTHFIYETTATACIVSRDFVAEHPVKTTLVRVPNAYMAFAQLLNVYNSMKQPKAGVSKLACISESAHVGEGCYIAEFVSIGENASVGNRVKLYPHVVIGDNVKIGDDTTIYAGVKIYVDCVVGQKCTLHAGTVIGADGFGFAPQQDEEFVKVAQIGNVVIEDHVEIGANCCIDRATIGSTYIRKGVKLDNLIQVAHNVEIGNNTVIAAQAGIAGSSKLGRNVMVGGQVGVSGHITLADEVKIAAQSGIPNNVDEKGAVLMGSPAFDASIYKRAFILFRKLPEIYNRLNALEKIINPKNR
jgi:UDP-3-O-[3-hydroxymyristoyl] glucosamine N-acyltransferase